MATNDSDDVGDLLEDIDDLDEQLFNRGKKRKDKPELAFQDEKKNETSGSFLNNIFSEPKVSKKSLNDIGGKNDSTTDSRFSRLKTPMDHLIGSVNRSVDAMSRLKQTATKPDPSQLRLNTGTDAASQPHSNFLSFLASDDTSNAQQQTSAITEDSNTKNMQHYDRSQRLEKEVDRLNREIDEIKRSKKRDEEELIQEWKEKLSKQKAEYEEMLEENSTRYRKKIESLKEDHSRNLDDLRDTLEQQFRAMQTVQQQTKSNDDVLKKVAELTDHIDAISTKVSNESDRSVVERETKIAERERILQYKEERLAKEEQRILDDRRLVDELNLKLRTLHDDKETELLKDKWMVKEERNKLIAEKASFKEQQRLILDALEKEKAFIEEAKTKFLAEQQDLLVRVISEKSLLEEEKMAFLAQRNSDVARIKDEAQKLDRKIIEVENAERLLSDAKQMYEIKYHMLVELEQALTDECNELDECRKQIENARQYQFKLQHLPFWNEVLSNINVVKPAVEVVADPYTSTTKPITRSDNAKALLQMNAQQVRDHKPEQEPDADRDVESI